jgi:hypothetical protein
MNLFRLLAYLAPPAAGLGVAAALALTRGRPPRRRLVAALAALGAVLLLLGLASFAESLRAFHAAALLTAGFAILMAGFFLFTEALRLPAEAGQVLSGLLAAALLASPFLFAPALRRAEESGASMESISRGVTRALEVNPFMAAGYSIFGRDLLRSRTFYTLGLEAYPFAPPRWGASAAGFALAGFVMFSAAVCLGALRLRLASPGRRGGSPP